MQIVEILVSGNSYSLNNFILMLYIAFMLIIALFKLINVILIFKVLFHT